MNHIPKVHLWQNIFICALIINIVVLDIIVFSGNINNPLVTTLSQNQANKTDITVIPTIIPTAQPSVVPVPTATLIFSQEMTKKGLTREMYIPIGSGSSKSSTWKALEGVEINIDTTKYPTIKETYFQASIRIPTANGRVYAKLVNETDKHDVWFSEVSNEGSIAIVKEAKINLDGGAKLYRVYLKSTLESEAILDQARIKLIVEE